MQITKYDKRFLIMWAVFLTLAGIGALLDWLGVGGGGE